MNKGMSFWRFCVHDSFHRLGKMETKTSRERIAHPEWSTMVGCIQARAERCAPRGSSFRETEGPRAWGRLPPSCKPNIALPTSLVAGAGQWARVPWGCSARQSRSTPSVPSFSQAPRSHTEVGPSGPRSGSGEVPLVSQPGSRGFPAFPSRRGQRCSRPGWMARSGRRSQPMASRGLRAAEEAWGGFGPLGFHLPAPHGNPCSSTPTLSHTTPQ